MDNRHRPVPIQPKTAKIHQRAPQPKGPPERLVSQIIRIGHPKVTVPVPVSALPLECFVPEPAPQPPVTLRVVAASGVELQATIAGKSFRKTMKAIVADGPMSEGQFVVIQGRLAPGGVIEEAGLVYAPKPPPSPEPGV